MANKKAAKATVDFQLLDNGTAKAVATPVDAAGLTTTLPAGSGTPAWSSSDTTTVVATPDPTDPSGLTATVTPATPPKLGTGIVVSVTATLPDGTSITGSGDPIDVVSGGPTGFSIAES